MKHRPTFPTASGYVHSHATSRVGNFVPRRCYCAALLTNDATPVAAPRDVSVGDLLSDSQDARARVYGSIREAFAHPDALGVIAVSGVHGLLERREALLSLAPSLARLPAAVLQQYEHPASNYSVGWSCGRETLQDGRPDTHKCSFYANPIYDSPASGVDPSVAAQYPSLYLGNIWPTAHVPALEGAFKSLGELVVSLAALLATHCDRLVAEEARLLGGAAADVAGEQGSIARSLARSRCVKGRLLHYRPLDADAGPQAWCGWHTDHGTLTGLTSAMYLLEGREGEGEQECSDPRTGLFVRTRAGGVVRVRLRRDSVAFQAGECLQIMSGGLLRATPHMVAGSPGRQPLSRNTFAVFIQPNADEVLATQGVADVGIARWSPGMNFGQFAESTIRSYYS